MNKKDSGWDLSDLEKEINSAIDSILVDKESTEKNDIEPIEIHPFAKEISSKASDYNPQPAPSIEIKKSVSREFKEKIEEIEAQFLTLEWDISTKHINSAINLLQDLKNFPYVEDELDKAVILIQKILYQFVLDESKLTPTAVKYLKRSWNAIKGMTDERFSSEIDKKALIRELEMEFEKLKIEEEPKEREVRIIAQKPSQEAKISFTEIQKLLERIQKLARVVNEERERWDSIQQELNNFQNELQNKFKVVENLQLRQEEDGIVELDERLEREVYRPPDFSMQQSTKTSIIAVSIFEISEVYFAIPETQILKTFPIKKWVSDFFIERGSVKLKNMEIPLFNLIQNFKLKPSTEENPFVLLFRGIENHPIAIIIDQALSREEIRYYPINDMPYILGKGLSNSGEVWILNTERLFL